MTSIRKRIIARKKGEPIVEAVGEGNTKRLIYSDDDGVLVFADTSRSLEWLWVYGYLFGKDDEDDMARARYQAGQRIRADWHGVQVSPVAGARFDDTPRGGAGRSPTDFMIDCGKRLRQLRRSAGDVRFDLMRAIIWDEQFVWTEMPKPKMRSVIAAFREGLDHALVVYGLMDRSLLTPPRREYGPPPAR